MKFNQVVKQIILNESNQMLSALVAQDQKERKAYQSFVKTKANGDWNKGAQGYAKSHNRNADDIFGEKSRLQKFIAMKFDFETFTQDDWKNYWLLAQHCDHDRQFQQKALNVIARYLGKDTEEFKYLSDRISCGFIDNRYINPRRIQTESSKITPDSSETIYTDFFHPNSFFEITF